MKRGYYLAGLLVLLAFCSPLFAFQWITMGEVDFSKAEAKIIEVRGNIHLIEIRVPQGLYNIAVLSGPDGYLLVDHPEAAAYPMVQKALDDLGKRPVKFLLNTHWHYDHVGGNEIFGPDATIVAQENVRKRLMTKQRPPWSPTSIGPYPERAWPRITFRDSLTIHFDDEDIEMEHYANGHTDGDSVVYFARANVVDLGDIFAGQRNLTGGIDMEGTARSLSAVLDRINDETIVITGHGELSNRRDLSVYISLLEHTMVHVRKEISYGKTEKEIVDERLPEVWKPWFAPQAIPVDRDFMQAIYSTVTHTSNLDQ
ncbi:MAG: MBL fold metallo-hydrolase [Terracidiphilus sp.]|jgi:glyoxylase-like metal-dependent hydrolase (beta-lactamase superfamily II)